MSYAEHRLERFTNPVSALADRPQLSPAKMKAAFDACPNELREKHNSLCAALDEGKTEQAQQNTALQEADTALGGRIDGIIAQAFPGEITRTMLEQPLQSEISAKAESTALARTDSRLAQTESRLDALTSVVADKANLVYGTFTTSEPEQGRVVLGFRPKFVLMFSLTSAEQDKSRFVHTMWGAEGVADSVLTIENDGFRITNVQGFQWSERNPHFYLALR